MTKIAIRICVGTYSYIMGGAELMNLQNDLPDEWKDKVKVDAVVGFEGREEGLQPPFVEINGHIMAEANQDKIIQYLETIAKK